MNAHTWVGIHESAWRRSSTHLLLTPCPLLNIQVHVLLTLYCQSSVSVQRWLRHWSSAFVPKALIWSFLIKQQGHGQPPRYRIVAKMILYNILVNWYRVDHKGLTFQDNQQNKYKKKWGKIHLVTPSAHLRTIPCLYACKNSGSSNKSQTCWNNSRLRCVIVLANADWPNTDPENCREATS